MKPLKSESNKAEREFTLEARHRLIAEAAYYRAECRAFETGCELDDWLAAEAEVDAAISREVKSATVEDEDVETVGCVV